MYYTVYKIKKGDSLNSIVAEFGTSLSSLKRLNPSAQIVEGERLLLAAGLGKSYTVMPYDTIESIANRFDVRPEAVTALNEVYEVYLGQIILIPER